MRFSSCRSGMILGMRGLRFVCVFFTATILFGADWNPRLAADYLDARQRQWFEWKQAKATGGPCISCHTGVTYLLARPALRRILGESQPVSYEVGLLGALRARASSVDAKDMFQAFAKGPTAVQAVGVETVLAALLLWPNNGHSKLDRSAQQSFDRLWSLQLKEGSERGAWAWFNLGLDPYEMAPSVFFGATLAALAVAASPAEYRNQPGVQERVSELNGYLSRARESQPLHNRLMLLWASTKLSGVLPAPARIAVINEAFNKQNADGGWTLQSLGPWADHAEAPLPEGT